MDTVIKEGGSDLHLSAGSHPIIRVDDALIPLQTSPELKEADTVGFLKAIINETQLNTFHVEQELDFSYKHKEKARFRGNAFFQQTKISIALRFIPGIIKTIEDLNLPDILTTFTEQKQGFFLVVGPVGREKPRLLPL